MSEVVLSPILVLLVISTVVGALVSLLGIAVSVANTQLGKKVLTTGAGRALLRVHGTKQLVHWLDRNLLYDIAFARMAQDHSYLEEARKVGKEFTGADWEAFQIREQSR